MPKKGKKKPQKNRQLDVTLPDGARYLLDQLVALKVVGDSYSGVIAFLVETQLQAMRRDYGLRLASEASQSGTANSQSIDAKPNDGSRHGRP